MRVDTFRSGGKGGQNQNKRDTGVRLVHEPSGAVGESREERSQLQNKKNAFNKLIKSKRFENWLFWRTMEIENQQTLEEKVIETTTVNDIKVEGIVNGVWTEIV
jgi:protein subunit release factor A